jgi:hypothetical protein
MAATEPRFQPDETSARIAGLAILGNLSLIALALAVVGGMLWAFGEAHPRLVPPPRPVYQNSAGPRLQAKPMLELFDVDMRAKARLQGYGWVDRKAGVARIPIDRAMAIQAERGWPDAEPRP